MKERDPGDWRWLAAWVAVAGAQVCDAPWGLMVVISAWGRGETAAHPEGPRPLRVYLRLPFTHKYL